MVKSISAESGPLDETFGFIDHARILPRRWDAENELSSLRLPSRERARKTLFNVIMEAAEEILVPLPRLLEARGVRPRIAICRIQMQFEVANILSILFIA